MGRRPPRTSLLLRSGCATVLALAVLWLTSDMAQLAAWIGAAGQGRGAARLAMQAKGKKASSGAVVDDDDFDMDDTVVDPGATGRKKVAKLESILDAADAFASVKDRKKKRGNLAVMSTESDLETLTLEDSEDITLGMEAKARTTGKIPKNFYDNVVLWTKETKKLFENPTKLQFTYAMGFFALVAMLIATGVAVIAAGAPRYRGDGVDWKEREAYNMDIGVRWLTRMSANKEVFMNSDDFRDADLSVVNRSPIVDFKLPKRAENGPQAGRDTAAPYIPEAPIASTLRSARKGSEGKAYENIRGLDTIPEYVKKPKIFDVDPLPGQGPEKELKRKIDLTEGGGAPDPRAFGWRPKEFKTNDPDAAELDGWSPLKGK